MRAEQIFQTLQEFEGSSRAIQDAAKAGFLEWALALPCQANPHSEARRALAQLETKPIGAKAGQLFVGYLRDASRVMVPPKRRSGARGRRGLLH